MKKIILLSVVCALTALECAAANALMKLQSINSARVLAQRNIVETVYGVKIRFIEEVVDLKEGNFLGTTETKTGQRSIKGITFEEKYDPANNIAQVTATLKLKDIADIIDAERFKLDKYPDKTIKRVAFASSSPAAAKKIAALRAAEIDAYKNLYKRIGGFTLESHTTVNNFVLKSDKVKASVIGALMGAEFVGFSWEGAGKDAIALVKLRLNVKELSEMLGQKIIDCKGDYIEATGMAAIAPDKSPEKRTAATNRANPLKISAGVATGKIDI